MPKQHKRKIKLKSNFIFDKKIAKKLVKADYYKAQGQNMKNLIHIENEKRRLATPPLKLVTDLLETYKKMGESDWISPIGSALYGMFEKNKQSILTGKKVINCNILGLVSHPDLLLLAYREIRGNKGSLTPGAYKTTEQINLMTEEQKDIYYKSNIFPDGFSLCDILLTSNLIRKGLYPWGVSSRVYVDKPGVKDKKRPITIPPFLDRVVQKAIELVLHSIYEPEFEKLNRSFGFRPNKGVHDAMTALLSYKTNGMTTALEGDVEAAYDTVDKEKLLEILRKKIKDKKFINFMRERLNYEYVEKETGLRVKPELGIPQGGIDSPYLFNIYMHELDVFIHSEVQLYLDALNSKPNRKAFKKAYRSFTVSATRLLKEQHDIKKELKDLSKKEPSLPKDEYKIIYLPLKQNLYSTIRAVRLLRHKKNKISSIEATTREIRLFYVRYADDWILLINGSKEIATSIKQKISNFLINELKLKLSDKKTLITNLTKNSAKFLGFELKRNVRGSLKRFAINKPGITKQKYNLQKTGGVLIWTTPDRQRLISRLHMKGFCTPDGMPKEIPWLSTLEPHVIIERFNASIRGLANFYIGIIRNNSAIYRWIYILRFSCLKTLATKYKTSITGIFKRFGHDMLSTKTQTIQVKVQLSINKDSQMEKKWKLLTYKDVTENAQSQKLTLPQTFWNIEKGGKIGDYPLKKGRIAKVTNEDYLESISWVNLRTIAAFDMPCANCGTQENIQMHHIRHIRKTSYVLIPEVQSYKQIMALRNRKQIPLCEFCHKNLVHKGGYYGPNLRAYAPTYKLVDNRVLHVESFVKPGESVYNAKSLESKGWVPIKVPLKDQNSPNT